MNKIPSSWSSLTWQQLCSVWKVKQRFGGQPDVAVSAALLDLLGLKVERHYGEDKVTGEDIYLLSDGDREHRGFFTVTPRQLAFSAREALPWFDFPYGDPGQSEKKDEKGNIVREHRDAHMGYVGPLRDALMLSEETVSVSRHGVRVKSDMARKHWWQWILHSSFFTLRSRVFALPQVACNNLTWQQYRALQSIIPQLWKEGITDEEAVDLQAQFLANILVPRSIALLDQSGDTIRLRPHYTFKYNNDQADRLVPFWRKRLLSGGLEITTLFHICHQVWQTSLVYYSAAYPLLFNDDGNHGPMRDALQGEVGTINTVMKYAGYSEQQQVYDFNLPFVLDILNTMTKEAKEIEAMNAKMKH